MCDSETSRIGKTLLVVNKQAKIKTRQVDKNRGTYPKRGQPEGQKSNGQAQDHAVKVRQVEQKARKLRQKHKSQSGKELWKWAAIFSILQG